MSLDLRALRAYAAERGVALVPNQQSLAHMEKWLRHSKDVQTVRVYFRSSRLLIGWLTRPANHEAPC